MQGLFQWPAPLLRKWLMLALIGFCCLVVGVVMLVINGDTILLGLSVILALLTTARCVIFYRRIGYEEYETIEGICISTALIPLQRRRSLTIRTDTGEEIIIRTDNRSVPHVGGRYRIYIIDAVAHYDSSHLLRNKILPSAFAVEKIGENTDLRE